MGSLNEILLRPPDQAADCSSIVRAAGVDRILTDEIGPAAENLPVVQGKCLLEHTRRDAHRSIQTEWILFTSGTTGRPKMAIHALSSLTGPLDDGLTGDAGAVWSTFYDIRRYGGLQILLRGLLGRGSLVLSNPAESTSELLVRLGMAGVTHISGTPFPLATVLIEPISQCDFAQICAPLGRDCRSDDTGQPPSRLSGCQHCPCLRVDRSWRRFRCA